MGRNTPSGAAKHHHRQMFGRRLGAATGGLEQRPGPVKRHCLAVVHNMACLIGLLDLGGGYPLHHLDQVGRHADGQLPQAQHHYLGHRRGEWQDQLERRSLAGCGTRFYAPAQSVHLGSHHIEPDAAASQFGHLVGGGEAGRENQVGDLARIEHRIGADQAIGNRLLAHPLQLQASAIVAELHRYVIALLLQFDADAAHRRLACGSAQLRIFDAVRNRVAQHVLECWCHALQHAAIQIHRAADDIQLDLATGVLGGLTHHAVQPLGDALKFDHPRTQQIALEFACLTRLCDQVVLGALHGALQVTLHSGHIGHRFGHDPGQLLDPGKPVKLQRVEILRMVFRLCHA